MLWWYKITILTLIVPIFCLFLFQHQEQALVLWVRYFGDLLSHVQEAPWLPGGWGESLHIYFFYVRVHQTKKNQLIISCEFLLDLRHDTEATLYSILATALSRRQNKSVRVSHLSWQRVEVWRLSVHLPTLFRTEPRFTAMVIILAQPCRVSYRVLMKTVRLSWSHCPLGGHC